jgi:predicted DNA-binding transcriptional regulator AlpA
MDRFLVWPQLQTLVPYSRQHIGRLEAKGLFPKGRWLSQNRVAWLESEILEWCASRACGGPPKGNQLRRNAIPAPEPDPEDLEVLHRLAAKFGLDPVPALASRNTSAPTRPPPRRSPASCRAITAAAPLARRQPTPVDRFLAEKARNSAGFRVSDA